jgi:hypothetical protein
MATFEGARQALRDLKGGPGLPDLGATVWIRGGTYERTSTFKLTAPDAGAADKPIRWRAFPGETVSVTGGT